MEPSETSIVELPESSYTHGIQASFTTFSDAAIVTFVRVGTENSDPKAGILDLQENEANLLRMIKKSGKFKIVREKGIIKENRRYSCRGKMDYLS